eukprot:1292585-Ditylum_brightwellii.AAC.1
MTNDNKHVKWQNGVHNHKNGELLPVLDPQIEGCKPVELYQWKMCIHVHSRGAVTKIPMAD